MRVDTIDAFSPLHICDLACQHHHTVTRTRRITTTHQALLRTRRGAATRLLPGCGGRAAYGRIIGAVGFQRRSIGQRPSPLEVFGRLLELRYRPRPE
eukprot:scaffold46200_cov66-Phaeocystis_antarctica.AAC.3